jgi:hypothetical protein
MTSAGDEKGKRQARIVRRKRQAVLFFGLLTNTSLPNTFRAQHEC